MSIEKIPELDVDMLDASGLSPGKFTEFEKDQTALVGLQASITSWDKVEAAICALRGANVSALLALRPSQEVLEDEEILYLFATLRNWDQMYLQNFLQICEEWVPKEFQQALKNEAKIEINWAKQWLLATSDPRIYKYPSLPWRSFIRKIVEENYQFSVRFLELAAAPATPENVQLMHQHIQAFLEAKKKVLCVFPKRWKGTEH